MEIWNAHTSILQFLLLLLLPMQSHKFSPLFSYKLSISGQRERERIQSLDHFAGEPVSMKMKHDTDTCAEKILPNTEINWPPIFFHFLPFPAIFLSRHSFLVLVVFCILRCLLHRKMFISAFPPSSLVSPPLPDGSQPFYLYIYIFVSFQTSTHTGSRAQ